MQTASKVEIDNWSDINGQNIMNIRPVGTYTKPCHCKPHHKPCWPPYKPWFPPIHEVHKNSKSLGFDQGFATIEEGS